MQVPVKEREKLLKKEGLDPTRLANLTLVYKVQEVSSAGFAGLTLRLMKPCGATSTSTSHMLTELQSESAREFQAGSRQMLEWHEPVCKLRSKAFSSGETFAWCLLAGRLWEENAGAE